MLDFAWSEFALIGVVALLVIGPKDMPVAIRAVKKAVKKLRGMASEFQEHFDEFMREADLSEVRNSVRDLRSMDVRRHIMRTVDGDGSLQRAMEPPVLPDLSLPDLSSGTGRGIATGELHSPDRIASVREEADPGLPAILPPMTARRIREEMPRLRRPAILPPVRIYHGSQAVPSSSSQAEH
ncbi:Sec-independent protein translocase protein TatB [Acetobacter sp. AN02]|nr:Sec-independent protein translocase protein TatB [Acetobacter sp. AN02]MDG6094906.1 Sec-independent protein translocase protein TatB [Acetobacter sp. AN02]